MLFHVGLWMNMNFGQCCYSLAVCMLTIHTVLDSLTSVQWINAALHLLGKNMSEHNPGSGFYVIYFSYICRRKDWRMTSLIYKFKCTQPDCTANICSAATGNNAFFLLLFVKDSPVSLWEYVRPLLMPGTVLYLNEQTCQPEPSNSKDQPPPQSKKLPFGVITAFFLPRHRLRFMFSCTCFLVVCTSHNLVVKELITGFVCLCFLLKFYLPNCHKTLIYTHTHIFGVCLCYLLKSMSDKPPRRLKTK